MSLPRPSARFVLSSALALVAVANSELLRAAEPIVAPVFLDRKDGGEPKIISFFAKKARGIMSGWLIRERITSANDIVNFAEAGYAFDPVRSTADRPVFVR